MREKMDGKLEMSLDKLPVKRLESIEENGFERFPTDIGYDEKQVSLIRRIDFAWAVEKEDKEKKQKKRQKKSSRESSSTTTPWPWQNMVENLRLAHQELSVIIDLINTVEANDAVTVAGMTRPKPLPNEILADLAVSTATKLQCYRSAKALEQQVAREARFYGALISGHSIVPKKSNKIKTHGSLKNPSKKPEKESLCDNECVKDTHLLLRKVHRTIFDEQVFDMVNRGAVNQSSGLNVTGIQENYLQLCIGPGISIFISVVPSDQGDQAIDSEGPENLESAVVPLDSFDGVKLAEEKHNSLTKKPRFPNCITYEIYLKQIFHEYVFVEAKGRPSFTGTRMPGQPANDGSGLLSHFCLSLSHRIISNKVLMELENVVCRVPYLHLISHPTWHSRSSAWTIFMKIPPSILHASSQTRTPDIQNMKNVVKSEFWTKVVAASQVIRWLHEEALAVGIKANRDFLCLSFELEQGEILNLVAHVDPEDTQGCISWWLTMEDGFAEEKKLHMNIADSASEYRKFLGYLPLDVLYSTLMDLVSLCGGGSH
ncbi:mediator of RNA polymerase II transcription subunit 17 isoform X1 [Populus alba x Populus x berolinensis]|uniref:Mediator of RNA polymerase II transcription subunit 17 isoform X1 n=1 Tax=Populus alba x Populus x berolinensis TaxID=444605 RepID=A0AAD6LLP6_9ROSI|nr:mediator of RNA polymerase II transcription subunit 17 isoform X1 [Populus alba x Populus x berolinensis]